MSLALKWGDASKPEESSGFIYFDAVTAYVKNYKGSVTKHPVDGGGNITDHFIRENPMFSLSAVITGADISTGSFLISDASDGSTPSNVGVAPSAVSVNSTDNELTRFLPDSISQFFSTGSPSVDVDTQRTDLIDQIREEMAQLLSRAVFNEATGQFDEVIQVVQLYEYQGTLLKRIHDNFVITSLTFKEDDKTGYGLYFDIQLEQVKFVSLKKVPIDSNVTASLSKQAASNVEKGKQDSTESEDNSPPETDRDGLRNPYGDTVEQEKAKFTLGQPLL